MVGPFAASTTIRARTAPALPACSTPPTAAGTRTSQSSASSSSLAIRSASIPSWPTTPARARRTSSPASRPAGFQTPPSASLTATIRQPRRARAAAAWLPTLPKPWIATRAPRSGIPIAPAASRATTATPSPVASTRPTVPPSSTGLPVTIAGVWPWSRPYSSISHAISAGPVPMSGAMMSRIGPSTFSSRSITARVARWSSAGESPLGSRSSPPLAPPKGRPASAVFQVIPAASARTPSRLTAGW